MSENIKDSMEIGVVSNAKRLVYIDYLRIICTLGVIIIHVTSNCIDYPQVGLSVNVRHSMEFMASVMRWCVPVFFMISGAIFLGYKKKCTFGSVYPYLIRFALILLTVGTAFCAMEKYFYSRTLTIDLLYGSFIEMLKGNSWDHMWYVYSIFGVYFLLPVLRPFFDAVSKSELFFWAILVSFFSILMPFLETCAGFRTMFSLHLSNLIAYVVIGGVLLKFSDDLNNNKRFCFFVSFLMCVIGFVWVVVLFAKEPNNFVARYTSVPIYLMAVSAFVMFLLIGDKLNAKVYLSETANCCWGIYLFHQVFINLLFKVVKFNPAEHCPIIMVPLTVLLLFMVTGVLVFVARKITFVKKYFL